MVNAPAPCKEYCIAAVQLKVAVSDYFRCACASVLECLCWQPPSPKPPPAKAKPSAKPPPQAKAKAKLSPKPKTVMKTLPKKKAEEAPPAKPKAPPAKPKAEVPEGEHADGAPPSTSKTDKAENTRHAGIIRIFFA